MGTWNTDIHGSDAFYDIYHHFFNLYNRGINPKEISRQIQADFAEVFEDEEERHSSLFALALAQWETKTLDPLIYGQVREIIESDSDIRIWKDFGADDETLTQRRKALKEFLELLSSPGNKRKPETKEKCELKYVRLMTLSAPDNKKTFEIFESYVNNEYESTSSGLSWEAGGGSIFYFQQKGKFISAKWIDNQTLKITHDAAIVFAKKEEKFYYRGDEGKIVYVATSLHIADDREHTG